ncbi:uncharacterized protein LOC106671305 [Cimex lectularius]|uniref:DUF4773 domain-containing protein n=1 Tax=Cimex lectularius TaxID=79782 RepID=A0A8I6S5H9_CIMLE|nr:uncharacterized protein LOC106671305 [Cimex lectularius]
MNRLLLFFASLATPMIATSISSGLERQGEEVQGSRPSEFDLSRPCTCHGVKCECCVDFNMTYVDLGGPGCITMKYLSKEEGLFLNVSYGDSQLLGEQIKGPNTSVTCMNVLLDLAQMCARISNIAMTEDGMRACADLEPTLLGDPQDTYHLGCFQMNPEGMQMINSTTVPVPYKEKPLEGIGLKPDNTEESLIAAVNESAEEGIAWFTSFLGLNFGKAQANETKDTVTDS